MVPQLSKGGKGGGSENDVRGVNRIKKQKQKNKTKQNIRSFMKSSQQQQAKKIRNNQERE